MKLKLDENLPASLAATLTGLGHMVDTVPDEGLAGKDDGVVWAAAQREERFFLTQDLDFGDVRAFEPGTHCGLLLLRLHEPSRRALAEKVLDLFKKEDVEGWIGCFVVVTENKTRVRRPATGAENGESS